MEYIQLLCHLTGDYGLQSPWMAKNKTRQWPVAVIHASISCVPFLFFVRPSFAAVLVIFGSHAVIDRYRLAKYVVFASQFLSPPGEWKSWADCDETGHPKGTPPHIADWLTIIVDNTIHLVINYLALRYL